MFIAKLNSQKGFTLIEILVALFVFSILSLLLSNALRNIINLQSGVEEKAQRLRHLQMVFLLMSRDIEQTVNRPAINAASEEEAAFVGSPEAFTLTHTGYANLNHTVLRSTLQRVSYEWYEQNLWRKTAENVDQLARAKPYIRNLLSGISKAHFQYVDKDGLLHDHWPLTKQGEQLLPRAIKITLELENWGEISQVFLIPAESIELSHAT